MIKGKDEIIKTYLEVKNSTDDTNIHYKQLIKETFLNSDELIYALNNDELKDCDNDEYFGVNILPYLIIYFSYILPQNSRQAKKNCRHQ